MKEVAEELRSIVTNVTPMLEAIGDDPELALRPMPEKWSRKEINPRTPD